MAVAATAVAVAVTLAVAIVARPPAAIVATVAMLAAAMVVASARLIVRRVLPTVPMHRPRRSNPQRVLLIAHRQNSNALVPTVVRHVSVANVQRLAMAMIVALRALVVTRHRVVILQIAASVRSRRATTAQHRASVTIAQGRALALIGRRSIAVIAKHVRHGAIAPRRAASLRMLHRIRRRAVNLLRAVIALNVVQSAMNVRRSRRRFSVPHGHRAPSLRTMFAPNAEAASQQVRL
jgi:hypothetical protein